MTNEHDARIQAHFFFLDMIAQEARADVLQDGSDIWTQAGIEPAALVGHMEKYYPPAVLAHQLTTSSVAAIARQLFCYGFLLGQRWEQQRDKEGDQ